MPKPISTPRTIPTILVLLLLLEVLFTIVGLNSGVILIAEIKGPCVWGDGMQQVPLPAQKKV